MNGAELRKLRLAKGFRLLDVGRRFGKRRNGVRKEWIRRIEFSFDVKPQVVEKYLAALAKASNNRRAIKTIYEESCS